MFTYFNAIVPHTSYARQSEARGASLEGARALGIKPWCSDEAIAARRRTGSVVERALFRALREISSPRRRARARASRARKITKALA